MLNCATKFYWPLALLFLTACAPEDITPSWLVISSIELSTDEAKEGVNSSNITDAWVFMDGQPLGVFSLPARIPILAEGQHDFIIYAGIKDNGISASRLRYPFYKRYEVNLQLTKGEELTIAPTVTYASNVQFELLEGFESLGIRFKSDTAVSDTSMNVIGKSQYPDLVNYGNSCAVVALSETNATYMGSTSADFNLPQNEPVYVEMDYLNDNTISLGVIAKNVFGSVQYPPLVTVNAQSPPDWKWKKIYINVTGNVNFDRDATGHGIYLISHLDDAATAASIYLDNIKVVRFQ